jgi:tripartite-type tricarboxylate transporter receptor subunit TctC
MKKVLVAFSAMLALGCDAALPQAYPTRPIRMVVETQERMKTLGAITVADTPSEFAAFLKKDHERWARVIKASGVKAE